MKKNQSCEQEKRILMWFKKLNNCSFFERTHGTSVLWFSAFDLTQYTFSNPKRTKTQTATSAEINSPIDWEKELYSALNDETVMDNHRPLSPVSPTTKDFGVQVRKRDFLTTSRDTQTEQVSNSLCSKVMINQSTQTIYIGSDSETQTQSKSTVDSVCQTTPNTTEQGCQADFFNAGLITHTLMDAIKSIAPYVKSTTSTQRQVASITPSPNSHPLNEPTRRRGRPRRNTPTGNNTLEDPILLW